MDAEDSRYYRADLALVHHLGCRFHADACAPGILALLEPVRQRKGLVVELGCGSGHLTGHLLNAGHRVVATDASPAMLDLARKHAPQAEDFRLVALPEDPLPSADAVVSVGHVLNYLPDEAAVERALVAAASALRPGGLLAVDLCDLRWNDHHGNAPTHAQVHDGWAVVTRCSAPAKNRFIREMTAFVRNEDGSWHRDDERHENLLVDASGLPGLLRSHNLAATVATSFGTDPLPSGLVALIGHRLG